MISRRRGYQKRPRPTEPLFVGTSAIGVIIEDLADQFDAFDACGEFVGSFDGRNRAVAALREIHFASLLRVGGVR